jgi:putative FmdB family regulatory protein
MPLYDFKCHECGRVSEILLSNADTQDVLCPECGSSNLEKLISSSYMIKTASEAPGTTCCGRADRCDTPPCSTGDTCRRR